MVRVHSGLPFLFLQLTPNGVTPFRPLQPKVQPKQAQTVGEVTWIASRNFDCALISFDRYAAADAAAALCQL